MAMNYANLGFTQIDFTGVDCEVETEQQMVAGTYAKLVDAINNGKILVTVNIVYSSGNINSPVVSNAYCNEGVVYLTASDISEKTFVITSDDKVTQE